MTRLGLFGNFGSANLGNEASLRVVAYALRAAMPGVELTCICPRPDSASRLHGMAAVSLRPLRRQAHSRLLRQALRMPRTVGDLIRAMRAARRFDAIIVPGTGILDDYGDVPTGMPYDLLVWSLAARLARTPFHLVAVGAGPINHHASRRMLGLAARLARSRSFRDEDSRDFMASIGLRTATDRVVPDVVFALDIDTPSTVANDAPVVGVGLMDYDGWVLDSADGAAVRQRYLTSLASVVAALVRAGFDAEIVSGETSDEAATEDFLALLPDAARLRVRATGTRSTLEDLAAQIAHFDVVLASRFHTVLAAMMTGVPAVSLGYAPKNEALLARFGLSGYCHDIESFEPDRVVAHVCELARDRGDLASRIVATREELRRSITDELSELGRRVGA